MKNIKKIQHFTLRIFLGSMVACAVLVLSIIWSGGPDHFGIPNQLAFTFFIAGLASFLIWIVTIILDIRDKIERK